VTSSSDARLRQPAGDVVEQLSGRRVGPVDVLDDEQQAALARRQRQQRDDRLEERSFACAGSPTGRPLVGAEQREELRELAPGSAELCRERGRRPGPRGSCRRLDEAGDTGASNSASLHAPHRTSQLEPARALRELRGQPRLSHPGLAAERHEAALAAVRPRAARPRERRAARPCRRASELSARSSTGRLFQSRTAVQQ
jgi:hypothetical protein